MECPQSERYNADRGECPEMKKTGILDRNDCPVKAIIGQIAVILELYKKALEHCDKCVKGD